MYNYEKLYTYIPTQEQQDLLIADQLGSFSNDSIINIKVKMVGLLNKDKVQTAFNYILGKHEALRTIFEINDSKLLANVYSFIPIKIKFSRFEENRSFNKPALNPFKGPLIDLQVIKEDEQTHYLWFSAHHAICDGTSMFNLIEDFIANYKDINSNNSINVNNFSTYAKYINKEVKKKEKLLEDGWRRTLASFKEPSLWPKPSNYKREKGSNKNFKYQLSDENKNLLLDLSHNLSLTPFQLFVGSISLLFCRYTGKTKFCPVSVSSAREIQEYENTIGMFSQTFPIAITFNPKMSFTEFSEILFTNFIDGLSNSMLPISQIQNLFPFSKNYKNVFPTCIVSQRRIDNPSWTLNTPQFFIEDSVSRLGTFEQIWSFEYYEDNYIVNCIYDNNLFSEEYIKQIFRHLFNLLYYLKILKNDEKPIEINSLQILDEEEYKEELITFNHTNAEYDKEASIVSLIYDSVKNYPNNIALQYNEVSLTYKELWKSSAKICFSLQNYNIKKEELVAVYMPHNHEAIMAMLGILISSAAYLPIYSDTPIERIEYILKDSKCRFIITTTDLAINVPSTIKNLSIIEYKTLIDNQIITKKEPALISPSQLAYIIYTSGTTGFPKGVLIEHKQVVRLITNSKFPFEFNSQDIWTLAHSISFDFSVWEIFTPLSRGAKIVIVSKKIVKSAEEFYNVLTKENITILNHTPSAFSTLTPILLSNIKEGNLPTSLRYVIFGGEALNLAILQAWKMYLPTTNFVNMYGITETTVHNTFKIIEESDIKRYINNIGKPIPTTKAYICNEALELMPKDCVGEIVIAGNGLARGYLNKEDLTNQRFVYSNILKGRVYKSGDLGRRLPTGEIEYLGRADRQIKLRGYRIELEEIEAHLLNFPNISKVYISIDSNPEVQNGERIVAYYKASCEILDIELRNHLKKFLPLYMIPSIFIPVKEIYLTDNGKYDISRLPSINSYLNEYSSSSASLDEVSKIGEIIIKIWEDLLAIKISNYNANFFEIGGNSLLAMILAAKLQEQFKGDYSAKDIFEYQTIKEQEVLINLKQKEGTSKIPEIEENIDWSQSIIYATSAQCQLYFQYEKNPKQVNYNIPLILKMKQDLEIEKLQQVLNQLFIKHIAFRIGFKKEQNTITIFTDDLQKEMPFSIVNDNFYSIEELVKFYLIPFDLSKPPLINTVLFKAKNTKEIWLIFNIHHIIVDGISLGILIKDLNDLLTGVEIDSSDKIDIRHFALWLSSRRKSDRYKKDQEFWQNMYKNTIARGQWPWNKGLPIENSLSTRKKMAIDISNNNYSNLIALSKTYNWTLNDILFAVTSLTLGIWGKTSDLAIAIPVSARILHAFHSTIGCMVNTLPIRCNWNWKYNLNSYINNIHELLIEAREHQFYDFNINNKETNDSESFSLISPKICYVFHSSDEEFVTLKGNNQEKYIFELQESGSWQTKYPIIITFSTTEQLLNLQIFFDENCLTIIEVQLLSQYLIKIIENLEDYLERDFDYIMRVVHTMEKKNKELIL